jgi:hypothetical protein
MIVQFPATLIRSLGLLLAIIDSADTTERRKRTALGYRRFRCRACKREFNERTGTSFNHLQYPTDVVCLVVLWRVRYKLSLQDISTHLFGLVGPLHDSGRGPCITQLAGLQAAHLIDRPFPSLPHAFATRV